MTPNKKKEIDFLVVTGPTATGKTKVAVDIASKYSGEIISADSRQVYKGMDIGSGKASKDIFFKLNMIVSLKMIRILKKYSIPKLSIKWPNDILSENKKIAGILIETSLKNGRLNDFIIGIGLNVNQKTFKNLPNATSIKKKTGLIQYR